MKNTFKCLALALLLAGFTGCADEPELSVTDVGPEMKVLSYDAAANMGGAIQFEVSLSDPLPLSTLKAQVYFDDEMVAESTIRTKQNGAYEGSVVLPFFKSIPNGEARLVFVGQNTHFGSTSIEQKVMVTRPDVDHLIYVLGSEEYRMERTGQYQYAVTGEFPQKPKGYIKTPALDEDQNEVTFGYADGGVVTDSTDPIPFSNSNAGTYTITFNTLTFEGSPFLKLKFGDVEMTMLDADNYYYVATLKQGTEYALTGIPDFENWDVDCDFFERTADGKLKFLAMNGMYKITANFEYSYLKMEAMSSSTAASGLTIDDNAIWVAGDGMGKPTKKNAPGWDIEKTGVCMAHVAKNKYQITLVAGISLSTTSINFKFFYQKKYDVGEFVGKAGAATKLHSVLTTASNLVKIGDGGNLALGTEKFVLGGVYRFTIETGEKYAGTLTIEKIGDQPLPPADLKINGTQMTQVDADNYTLDIDLTQNGAVTFSGDDVFAPAWINPDFFTLSGSSVKLAPVTGKYRILVNTSTKVVDALALKADGSGLLTLDNTTGRGAIYYIGYGVGSPDMSEPGWTTEKGICVPEFAPGIYKMTAQAGKEKSTTLGQRFRLNGWDGKFFAERGWTGLANALTLAPGAEAYFTITGGGNINMAADVYLIEGATYELTISFVADPAHPTLSIVKK